MEKGEEEQRKKIDRIYEDLWGWYFVKTHENLKPGN